jgi:hypothetical protein
METWYAEDQQFGLESQGEINTLVKQLPLVLCEI